MNRQQLTAELQACGLTVQGGTFSGPNGEIVIYDDQTLRVLGRAARPARSARDVYDFVQEEGLQLPFERVVAGLAAWPGMEAATPGQVYRTPLGHAVTRCGLGAIVTTAPGQDLDSDGVNLDPQHLPRHEPMMYDERHGRPFYGTPGGILITLYVEGGLSGEMYGTATLTRGSQSVQCAFEDDDCTNTTALYAGEWASDVRSPGEIAALFEGLLSRSARCDCCLISLPAGQTRCQPCRENGITPAVYDNWAESCDQARSDPPDDPAPR